MIPREVGDLAELICPDWSDGDEDVQREVLAAAYRVHNAGFRPLPPPTATGEG